jgi:hypothetical protein
MRAMLRRLIRPALSAPFDPLSCPLSPSLTSTASFARLGWQWRSPSSQGASPLSGRITAHFPILRNTSSTSLCAIPFGADRLSCLQPKMISSVSGSRSVPLTQASLDLRDHDKLLPLWPTHHIVRTGPPVLSGRTEVQRQQRVMVVAVLARAGESEIATSETVLYAVLAVTHDEWLVAYRTLLRLGESFEAIPIFALGQSLQLQPPPPAVDQHRRFLTSGERNPYRLSETFQSARTFSARFPKPSRRSREIKSFTLSPAKVNLRSSSRS